MNESHDIIGRGPLLASIREQLNTARVLTFRGPGGVGKTTLARNVATERGAPFVELDLCGDVDDIAAALGELLGLPEIVGTSEGVAKAMADAAVPLVILDNAEHLTEGVAQVVEGWLATTPTRFLITSRERLNIDGEVVVDITPLGNDDAVRLFELRAQDASKQFVLDESNRDDVLELIKLVNGLPLGIELAACRVKVLTPRQICERLDAQFDILRAKGDDVLDRHATLDACVEWSWSLLSELQRDVLRQVAIFRGRFTIDEAEALVTSDGWVGDVLEELVERSLIWLEHGSQTIRFSLYDGVRRFVDRHTDRDEELIERYATRLRERVLGDALAQQDLANILHAFELCIDHQPELAIELLVEGRQKLWRAGFLTRLFEMLERALQVEDLDSMWRASLWMALASNHYSLMDYVRMEDAIERTEKLLEGDERPRARRTVAHAMLLRAVYADQNQRLDEGDHYYSEAKRDLDLLPPVQRAHVLAACGLASMRRGRMKQAVGEHEQSIEAARMSPDRLLLARTLSWSAYTYTAINQLPRAIARLEEALDIYDGHPDVISRAVAQQALAITLIGRDDDRAKEMARAAMESAKLGRLRVVEAMGQVLVARLEPTPDSATIIRRAMRVFGEDSASNDRWGAWVSLLVVLVHFQEFDAAAQEAEFLAATTERVAAARESRWCRRYLTVIHALRGDTVQCAASTTETEFTDAVERSLKAGRVSDEDHAAFNDQYLLYVHDRNPLPLELLARHLDVQVGGRRLRLVDEGRTAILPDGEEIDLETRYVLRRLLIGLCESHQATPGRSLTLEELVEVGWPDEQMTYESGVRRVYSAIRNLRKLGFEDVLLTGESGYHIDAEIELVRE